MGFFGEAFDVLGKVSPFVNAGKCAYYGLEALQNRQDGDWESYRKNSVESVLSGGKMVPGPGTALGIVEKLYDWTGGLGTGTTFNEQVGNLMYGERNTCGGDNSGQGGAPPSYEGGGGAGGGGAGGGGAGGAPASAAPTQNGGGGAPANPYEGLY